VRQHLSGASSEALLVSAVGVGIPETDSGSRNIDGAELRHHCIEIGVVRRRLRDTARGHALDQADASVPRDERLCRHRAYSVDVASRMPADFQNTLKWLIVTGAPRGSFRSSTAFVAIVLPCMTNPT